MSIFINYQSTASQRLLWPLAALLCALAMAFAPLASAGVFKVSKDGRTLFLLGGTIHVLPADSAQLPDNYSRALGEADALCLETDIEAIEDPAFASMMVEHFQYGQGQSLQTALGSRAYQALSEYSSEHGVPIAMLHPFKPGFVLLTIELTRYAQLGMGPPGVDKLLHSSASAQGKTLCPLETPEQQLHHLVAAIGDMDDDEVLLSVEQGRAMDNDSLRDFVSGWRKGDMKSLDAMAQILRDGGEESYRHLIKLRNDLWMQQITGALQDSAELEFIAVGSGHLGGPDGLIPQLQRAGYSVTPY